MKVRIVLIIFLLIYLPSWSQNYLTQPNVDVDSLILAAKDQHDEELIKAMAAISKAVIFDDFEKGRLYADSALDLAKEINYEEGIAAASRMLGWYSFLQSDHVKALLYMYDALQFYEQNDNRLVLARLYNEIAFIHNNATNFEKSVEYYEAALKIFRERTTNEKTVGGFRDTIDIIVMLAENFLLMDIEHQKQLDYTIMALRAKENNNVGIEELILSNFLVGVRYIPINIDSAMAYFRRSLKYQDENLSIQALKRRSQAVIGNLHYSKNNLDSALYYLEQNYQWYYDHGILIWAHDALTSLATIHLANNNIKEGEQYLQKAEGIFNEMQFHDSWYNHDSLESLVTFGYELYFPLPRDEKKKMMWTEGKVLYEHLYEINVGKGNINEALKYHIAYTAAKDTLNRIQKSREVIELQLKFETEQKEREIDLLQQENLFNAYKLRQTGYLLFGLAGFVVLIILLAVIIIRNNRLRETQNNLILQQKLLRSQMNPHFLFNTLVGIQNFIVNHETVLAGKYLSKYSKLVRSILDSSFKEQIVLSEEINTLENYLELQKIRFPEKFEYKIELSESLDSESIYLPPILIQPFVENAIEHGIQHKKGKGQINLRFLAGDHQLICEIEDDGVGREKAGQYMSAQKSQHKSLATGIVMERIKNLNRNLKNKIEFKIVDLWHDDGSAAGTKVEITLPL